MNNKKGFTMVELLATIVILGILSTTAIVAVSRVIASSKMAKENQNKNSLEMATKSYVEANRDLLPKEIGEEKIIYAYELKDANYLKNNLTDASNNDCTGTNSSKKSYVKVYKYSKTDYSYTPVLFCGSGSSTPTPSPTSTPTININITGNKLGDAKIKINISDSTPIQGYSYSIVTNISGVEHTIYNSGTLSAHEKTSISVEKKLNDCINLTDKTTITVKATARNNTGGYTANPGVSKQIDIDY